MQVQKKLLMAVVMGAMPFAAPGQTSGQEEDDGFFSMQFDKLEYVRARAGEWVAYDGQASLGGAKNQLVLKAEGVATNGELREAKSQFLWGHSVATSWDTQLGVRLDHGRGIAQRQWLVLGAEGFASGWLDIDLAAHVGSSGRAAVELDMASEVSLARRMYLRPRIEMDFYSRNDEKWGIGSGLSEVTVGLRLI